MHFEDTRIPDVDKPLIIAAMQDMGNVGSIVVNHINKSLGTASFRHATSSRPPYVYDKGGYIEIPEEKWEYRFAKDIIVFGGGRGQPQENEELKKDNKALAKQIDDYFNVRMNNTRNSGM